MKRAVMLIGWFVYLLCFSAIAWAQEANTETFRIDIRAHVTAYCDTGSEYVKCEDIPVYELTEEDYEEPPPAMDVLNAWRLNGIETAGGE